MRLPRVRLTMRRIHVVVIVAIVPLACLRAYHQAIPAGVEFFPFWFASVEGPRLVSPDRKRDVQVMFNDAGAAHSGNHWTWVISDDWLMGKRVVAKGYSLSDVRMLKVPFPLQWVDNRTFSVDFVAKRYENAASKSVVHLP